MSLKERILKDKSWSLGILYLTVLISSMIYVDIKGNSLDTTEWFIICAINGILLIVSMVYTVIHYSEDINK